MITLSDGRILFVYFQQNKKDEDQGKERCHTKHMMSDEVNERLYTHQHVSLLGRTFCSMVVYFQQNKKRRKTRKGKVSR
jgi:hypothetical protein